MKYQPNRLGTMIDCSRNAVASVESVKKWIDLTSSIGYNTLMLYTEDTYEVSGEPYFGYMRGRYSREELRGLDAYAKNKNMELIPCIQTLAHLNALNRWPEYKEHFDVDDILLAQDERVYLLIDHMFATLADLLLFCCMMLSTLSCATWKLQTVQNTSLVKSIHRAIRWSAPV